MKNECIFQERLYRKIGCWRLRGTVLSVGLGSVQWMTSMLYLFLPSLMAEDRQWIRSLYLPGLSWVVTIMPLYSRGRAARLVVPWSPACPDITNLFSFSCIIPSVHKMCYNRVGDTPREVGNETKLKTTEKASKSAATISFLSFEMVVVSDGGAAIMSRIILMLAFQKRRCFY